jgi:hypothetical protein
MTLQEDVTQKQKEITTLTEERPGTKQEYLSALDKAQGELDILLIRLAEEEKKIVEEATNTPGARIAELNLEYDPQFSDLSKAYMSALILGDTETMTANRTAYQALLDEYNTKLEAIG